MSHNGLTKPFYALEKMQTEPFVNNISDNDAHPLTQFLPEESNIGFSEKEISEQTFSEVNCLYYSTLSGTLI